MAPRPSPAPSSRPSTARPTTSGSGTGLSDAMLQKTMKLNAERPASVGASPYRPTSRASKLLGGTMNIKDSKMFEDLVLGGVTKKKTLAPLNTNAMQGLEPESARAMRQKFLDERRAKMEQQRAEETEQMKRTLRWKMADANAARDSREAARIKGIQDRQEGFVKELDTFMDNKLAADVLASKALLYEWDNKVYKRIENQIAKRLEKKNAKEVNARLNDQMDKYVDAVKSKVLFRDIIIESEYNPFESKKAVIQVDARPRSKQCWDGIKDPLNEQIEKVMEIHEGKTLPESGRDAKGKNPGKTTLPLNEWATGVIEDTPHGFAHKAFVKSVAEANLTFEQKQQRAARNVSTLTLNHYSYAKGKAAMDAEYPKGKRCFPGWKAGQNEGQNAPPEEEGVGALFKPPLPPVGSTQLE